MAWAYFKKRRDRCTGISEENVCRREEEEI